MDDLPAQPMGLQDKDRDRLIESIYRIALEPQTYDAFMGTWDTFISSQSADLASLRDAGESRAQVLSHPEIATHFEIAEQLLAQMGRPQAIEDSAKPDVGHPQFLVDAQARIVWTSTAAANLFGIGPAGTVDKLHLPPDQQSALSEMAIGLIKDREQTQPGPLLLQISRVGSNTGEVVHMVARILAEQDNHDLILVTKVTPDWPPGMQRLLTQGFGLTTAEIEICEHLAEGQSAHDISQARNSAIATVRTQIKRIMAKTHTKTQADLVRVIHSVMRIAETDMGHAAQAWSYAERTSSITLPDRVLPLEHYGDPDGDPVIFFHGMLDGNTMNREMRSLLKRHRIRLICPIRPWFGTASGSEGHASTAPVRFATDIGHLIKTLKLRNPILMGHMAGALYAHAAARLLPQGTVAGVVGVSGAVPIVSLNQFSSMSHRQRLVAYTARYTPAILPFVLRAGINQLDNGGERTFLQSLYENSPNDQALLRDPETRDLMLAGFRFTVQQGHKAFEIDSHNVVRDWSEWIAPAGVPVHLIHGRHDHVVSCPSVEAFAARYAGQVTLDVMDEAGQLILYQCPEHVIGAICSLRDQIAPSR